jgi:Protein of unknown function (DUF2950)
MNTLIAVTMACVLLLAPASGAAAEPTNSKSQVAKSPASGMAAQRTFDTAREAADALVAAAGDYDVAALKAILGPAGVDLVVTKDPVQDRNEGAAFAAMAHQKTEIVTDPKNPNRVTLVIGDEDWPSPLPIVRKKGKWSFDAKAGRQEILNRRIGRNELDAIAACHGFVEAQREYASEKHEDAGVNQYAQRIIGSPGKQDGLVWRNPDGTWEGPLSEEIAEAIAEGYSDRSHPYHGYYFKVLKSQGPAARLGKIDFVVNGLMIGGFALVAAPADYRVTGVKTFLVSHEGVVYEKDLGKKTLEAFRAMEVFNPDKSWTPVQEP